MSFTYGFFDAIAGDRKYNALQVNEIFDGIITDGIIRSWGQAFAISPVSGSMSIRIGTGLAWFNHTWTKNDSAMTIRISASNTIYSRYDTVYLEVNTDAKVRNNSIKVLEGEWSINPVRPTLTNTETCFRYPLAYISIPAKATTIPSTNIESLIGTAPTSYAASMLTIQSVSSINETWNNNWSAYFTKIKETMEGYDNPATSLIYKVLDKLDVSDKATTAEATVGTNNSKWMTPYTTKQAIDPIRNVIYAKNLGIYISVKGVSNGSEYVLKGA